jgi:hypothetical protein
MEVVDLDGKDRDGARRPHRVDRSAAEASPFTGDSGASVDIIRKTHTSNVV